MADVNLIGYGVNPQFDAPAPIVRKRVIDFAEATAKKGSALAQNDVLKAITVNAGEAVVNVYMRIITASTASQTVAIGDTSGTSSYLAASATDATAGTIYKASGAYIQAEAAPPTLKCKLYTAASTIDVLLASATVPTSGTFEVIAEIIPVVK